MMAATDLWTLAVIVGLGGVTVLTRCFFFILERPWTLPEGAQRALQYAPVAALAGVIVPEIVMTQGQLAAWHDARIFGAVAAAALFFWRRSVLLTLVGGMAVYLPLKLVLGW